MTSLELALHFVFGLGLGLELELGDGFSFVIAKRKVVLSILYSNILGETLLLTSNRVNLRVN